MNTVRDLVQPDDWLTKIDLKDANFTIPIAEDHQKFLRFMVGSQFYQFTCLPFGLLSAPRVFTKTLRPVAALLRELGVRLVTYIDNILVIASSSSSQQANDHMLAVTYLLENLGYIIHPEKSVTRPTQRVEFLGMLVDTTSMDLSVPGEKIKKIRTEAWKLRAMHHPSAREVSRLIGKMNAVAQAIPPALLFYRSLQRDLRSALERGSQNYEEICSLSQMSREELDWWINHLESWNGKSLIPRHPDLVRVRCLPSREHLATAVRQEAPGLQRSASGI